MTTADYLVEAKCALRTIDSHETLHLQSVLRSIINAIEALPTAKEVGDKVVNNMLDAQMMGRTFPR